MQRRGTVLRQHIVTAAGTAFLEQGFDRTSMDLVASRAETSKRSLYAHFPSKDALLLAVVESVREQSLELLGVPDADEAPGEAAARYCARFLQLVVWEAQIATCRLSIGEAVRSPDIAHEYFERIFQEALRRLGRHLQAATPLDEPGASASAYDMVALTVLPRLIRTLLGVEPPIAGERPPSVATLDRDVDLSRIRKSVDRVLSAELAG